MKKTHGDEFILQPVFVLDRLRDLHVVPADGDRGVGDVWELGVGVVAPDDDVVHVLCRHPANTQRNLKTSNK